LVHGHGFRAEVETVEVDDRVEDGARHACRAHGTKRRAVLDKPCTFAVVPDEMWNAMDVGVCAGGNGRQTDRRQRGERRDRARVAPLFGEERERRRTVVANGGLEHRRRQPVDDDQYEALWPGRPHWWMCRSRAPSETRTRGAAGLDSPGVPEDAGSRRAIAGGTPSNG